MLRISNFSGFLALDITVQTSKGGIGSSFPLVMVSRGACHVALRVSCVLSLFSGTPKLQFNGSAPMKFRTSRRVAKVKAVCVSIMGSKGLVLITKTVADDQLEHSTNLLKEVTRDILNSKMPPPKAINVDDSRKCTNG